MVNLPEEGCSLTGGVVKGLLFQDQAGFSSLAEGEKDQRNGTVGPVTQKQQPLGLQTVGSCPGDEIPETLRPMDQKQVAAVF